MGILDRVRKKPVAASSDEKASTAAKKTKKAAPVKETVISSASASARKIDLLLLPRLSEKAAGLTAHGTYVFNVPLQANKIQVRKAVEERYKINVVSVRTVRGIGKRVNRGRVRGQRSAWKKAIVTVKAGQKIDLYEGV